MFPTTPFLPRCLAEYELRKMIRNLNVDAFITVTDVSEIIGNYVKKKR